MSNYARHLRHSMAGFSTLEMLIAAVLFAVLAIASSTLLIDSTKNSTHQKRGTVLEQAVKDLATAALSQDAVFNTVKLSASDQLRRNQCLLSCITGGQTAFNAECGTYCSAQPLPIYLLALGAVSYDDQIVAGKCTAANCVNDFAEAHRPLGCIDAL